jgi:2,4-dienoyl-CoA reductase-like NADH-dependent reductase (Old Yellow Enzyme family)
MARHFPYRSLDELARSCDEVGASSIRLERDRERIKTALSRKVDIGPIRLGNSIAIQPMEGCDGTCDGCPGELTWRRYERFAQGGAKLIWFEATAVCQQGRANTRQLWLNETNVDHFARLLDRLERLHRERYGTSDDLLVPVQLTHSGRYSVPRPTLAYHSPLIDEHTHTAADTPIVSDDELERLEDYYLAAGRLALRAGFRAVDLKVAHGYLLSELMGAKQRAGRYGGTLENRTRFVRNVMGKFRAEFGRKLILAIRLGCYDGVPYVPGTTNRTGVPLAYPRPYCHGFGVSEDNPLEEDLSEVKCAIAMFREAGLELLNVSMGSPYYDPHIVRPFELPDEGNYERPEHPLLGVNRHFRIAGELQRTFPDLPMVGSGYSWLQTCCINAAARNIDDCNIAIFGLGRGSLAYPEFARDAIERGELDPLRVCKTLSFCTYLMRQKNHPLGQWPTGCPPFDKQVYGPLFKEARLSRRVRSANQSNSESPPCRGSRAERSRFTLRDSDGPLIADATKGGHEGDAISSWMLSILAIFTTKAEGSTGVRSSSRNALQTKSSSCPHQQPQFFDGKIHNRVPVSLLDTELPPGSARHPVHHHG